ncbi:MAG: TetR/AcrR family transcriptional regulator [Bifidobacteriaceae bacterium]|jgi:AcrR family transcriptional regulator|nr:TetR/AcrR family transcriptional regulator [Bifidobacteriaceae bacterium]
MTENPQSPDHAEPADPTQAADPADPTQAADPAGPTQAADPADPTTPADDATFGDLGAAAKAFAEAAGTLTKALASSFQETQPYLSGTIASGLREAAEGIHHASNSVKSSAASFAAQRRAERTAKTRADLVAAATRVIAARGYDACSVEDIAQAAGYTKGALYSQFGCKQDLFKAVATAHLAGAFAPDATPAMDSEQVALTLDILAYALRHPDFASHLTSILDDAVTDLAATLPPNETGSRETAIGLIALTTAVPAIAKLVDGDAAALTDALSNRLTPAGDECR